MGENQGKEDQDPHRQAGRCNGPDCTSRSFIKAHIIPAGFARTLHSEGGYNLRVVADGARRARHQLGAFDKTILCAQCDRKLGRLDDYALKFTQRPFTEARIGRLERIDGVSCSRLAAFVTSVIWRASISSHPDFAGIDLGPHSDRARDIAFGDSLSEFPVIANRLSSNRLDVRHVYVLPSRRRLRDLNTYVFTVGGFQFHLIADSRPVPLSLWPLVINGQADLVSFVAPFEGTAEYRDLRQVARAGSSRTS